MDPVNVDEANENKTKTKKNYRMSRKTETFEL